MKQRRGDWVIDLFMCVSAVGAGFVAGAIWALEKWA